MNDQFIEGVPEALEARLASYNPDGLSNISIDELRASIIGYIPVEGWSWSLRGKEIKVDPLEDVYFFFPKTEGSLDVKLGGQKGMYVALRPDKYGFSPDRRVKISPKILNLKLSEQAREAYDKILGSDEMPINDLLESVGFIVNDSMRYDFDKIISLEEGIGNDTSEFYEQQGNYTQNGREVIKGICVDAGKIIREILYSLGMEESFGITYVSSKNEISSHDTTLVFDKESGEWAVINSKSPTKPYNLVPQEKLSELGIPYV